MLPVYVNQRVNLSLQQMNKDSYVSDFCPYLINGFSWPMKWKGADGYGAIMIYQVLVSYTSLINSCIMQ